LYVSIQLAHLLLRGLLADFRRETNVGTGSSLVGEADNKIAAIVEDMRLGERRGGGIGDANRR
jgi:hypothetical protein